MNYTIQPTLTALLAAMKNKPLFVVSIPVPQVLIDVAKTQNVDLPPVSHCEYLTRVAAVKNLRASAGAWMAEYSAAEVQAALIRDACVKATN